MNVNYKIMKDETLVAALEKLVGLERTTLADLIECIREIDERRLFLSLGYPSLFSYLTEGLGYSSASAQRRIDAARMTKLLPEVKENLSSGSLNLMQVSLVAQGLRQKEKHGQAYSITEKRDLLERLKTLDLADTQKVLAKELDFEIKNSEKIRPQKDDSTRMEITFTKEQMEKVQRARELLSHSHPSANWAEILTAFADAVIQKKDPTAEKRAFRKITSKLEVATEQELTATRQTIPASTRRFIYQRDRSCQWIDKKTGRKCDSMFQLQIDHIQPVWAGGDSSSANLQILCASHNHLKYQRETGTKFQ